MHLKTGVVKRAEKYMQSNHEKTQTGGHAFRQMKSSSQRRAENYC